MKGNITKGEVYSISPFMDTFYEVVGSTITNVEIKERTCTYHAWKMFSMPCPHAYSIILSINVSDFVDDLLKFPA